MAAGNYQESSSSSFSRCKYQVFLSFRGQDTRKSFTDHLYTALVQARIHTFRDDDEIERGENIESELQQAILQSKIFLIVFSKDYASSRWCLDELVMIMERKRTAGCIVLPVFYDVDPTQVRKQTGSFAASFVEHEKRFKEEVERVNSWRNALKDVADIAGKPLGDGYESLFIQNIVKEVENKLSHTALYVDPILVGRDSLVERINLWLQDGSTDVDIATIYGIGGIGKTTIAKTVYNLNYSNFESSSFIANVRETSEQSNGLVRLQRKLLKDLLKRKADKIYNKDEGIIKIKNVVCCKRVLFILDDVDQLDQFNAIIGMPEWFYPGSKIIITTRHHCLLRAFNVRMFEVYGLYDHESLQLFSWHAFGQGHPEQGYEKHSENVVQHCGGLPLALQVLGSTLRGKCADVWKSTLQKLETILDNKIQKVLRISYDSLEEDNDKSLFLDIACFFVGMDVDYVVQILNGCNYSTIAGIENLKDRYLITLNWANKLMMHQLVREMGRNIVRQESPDDPGKRSRLWRNDDVLLVLSENTGTDSIKGLKLHDKNSDDKLMEDKNSDDKLMEPFSKRRRLGSLSWQSTSRATTYRFSSKAFAKMQNLKKLHLNDVKLDDDGYEDFPKSLVWLYWRKFPLKSIPDDMCLEKLVVLDMKKSNLKHVWNGIRGLGKLKILDLSHSEDLVESPNFTGVRILEKLVLKYCVNLVELHESIGDLKRLVSLNLDNCRSLKKLPEKITMLNSLEELILSGCSNLVELPESIGDLKRLVSLNLDNCRSLKKLPGKITMLNSLEKLILSGCSNLVELPKDLKKMESMRVLRLDGIAIDQAQRSITKAMEELSLSPCISPKRFPRSTSFSLAFLPGSLVKLNLKNCNLSDTNIPEDLSCLPSLQKLNLSGNPISSLPGSMKRLSMLYTLKLKRCTRLLALPELPTSLEILSAKSCTSLERIGNHHPNLCEISLIRLDVDDSDKLVEVEGRYKLVPLESINIEILHKFGLLNVERLESIELYMYNDLTGTGRRTKIEMVCEHGIDSTHTSIFSPLRCLNRGSHWVGINSIYLPIHPCRLPDWVSHQTKGSSISFEVPSAVGNNNKIIGLSLCILYTSIYNPFLRDDEKNYWLFSGVSIHNETKGVTWEWDPVFFAYPEHHHESMQCLSYWMFENDQLEGGDRVEVSARIVADLELTVTEYGIRLLREQDEVTPSCIAKNYYKDFIFGTR